MLPLNSISHETNCCKDKIEKKIQMHQVPGPNYKLYYYLTTLTNTDSNVNVV